MWQCVCIPVRHSEPLSALLCVCIFVRVCVCACAHMCVCVYSGKMGHRGGGHLAGTAESGGVQRHLHPTRHPRLRAAAPGEEGPEGTLSLTHTYTHAHTHTGTHLLSHLSESV